MFSSSSFGLVVALVKADLGHLLPALMKSSLRATKSVSQAISTTAMAEAVSAMKMRPSFVARPARFSTPASPHSLSFFSAFDGVAVGLDEGLLAVHHARAGLLAQDLYVACLDIHGSLLIWRRTCLPRRWAPRRRLLRTVAAARLRRGNLGFGDVGGSGRLRPLPLPRRRFRLQRRRRASSSWRVSMILRPVSLSASTTALAMIWVNSEMERMASSLPGIG